MAGTRRDIQSWLLQCCVCMARVTAVRGTLSAQEAHTDVLLQVRWQHEASLLSKRLSSLLTAQRLLWSSA